MSASPSNSMPFESVDDYFAWSPFEQGVEQYSPLPTPMTILGLNPSGDRFNDPTFQPTNLNSLFAAVDNAIIQEQIEEIQDIDIKSDDEKTNNNITNINNAVDLTTFEEQRLTLPFDQRFLHRTTYRPVYDPLHGALLSEMDIRGHGIPKAFTLNHDPIELPNYVTCYYIKANYNKDLQLYINGESFDFALKTFYAKSFPEVYLYKPTPYVAWLNTTSKQVDVEPPLIKIEQKYPDSNYAQGNIVASYEEFRDNYPIFFKDGTEIYTHRLPDNRNLSRRVQWTTEGACSKRVNIFIGITKKQKKMIIGRDHKLFTVVHDIIDHMLQTTCLQQSPMMLYPQVYFFVIEKKIIHQSVPIENIIHKTLFDYKQFDPTKFHYFDLVGNEGGLSLLTDDNGVELLPMRCMLDDPCETVGHYFDKRTFPTTIDAFTVIEWLNRQRLTVLRLKHGHAAPAAEELTEEELDMLKEDIIPSEIDENSVYTTNSVVTLDPAILPYSPSSPINLFPY